MASGLLPDRHPQCRNAQDRPAAGDPHPEFGSHVVACLTICWMLTRTPAGKRLAPMLATIVPLLRRDGELVMTDAEAALLVSMSAASIDRHLAPERAKLFPRGRSHTKPGTLLKSQIPIRTWAQWSENMPDLWRSTWWATRGATLG